MRRAFTLAIVLTLALRCLVPAGVMLSTNGDGQVAVVLCTGHGPLTVHVDGQGRVVPDKPNKSQQDTLCPFASVGAVALDAMPAVLLSDLHYLHAVYVVAAVQHRPAFQLAAARPRGPPFDLT